MKAPTDDFQEVDSSGRFINLGELLGAGAAKTVYKAIDRDKGIEVAWNQLKLDRSTVDFAKLYGEVEILKELEHPNIIEFYAAWVDEKKAQLVFITECMTAGNLRQFLHRAYKTKSMRLRVIKLWVIQILDGLIYLHTRTPPIIHRDIKCDNIFVNNSGELKIGDLGLATVKRRNNAYSVIGTPEFMAPEFYEESYNEKVDVWAFGMSLLEMVTLEYPYSECENAAQIFRKVTQGLLPAALKKILHPELLEFLNLCLRPDINERPSAIELRQHYFLSEESIESAMSNYPVFTELNAPLHPPPLTPSLAQQHEFTLEDAGFPPPQTQVVEIGTSEEEPMNGDIGQTDSSDSEEHRVEVLAAEKTSSSSIDINLRLHLKDGWEEVKFGFNLGVDTAERIAQEMGEQWNLPMAFQQDVAFHIKETVKALENADYDDLLSDSSSDPGDSLTNGLDPSIAAKLNSFQTTKPDSLNNIHTSPTKPMSAPDRTDFSSTEPIMYSESRPTVPLDPHLELLDLLKKYHEEQLTDLDEVEIREKSDLQQLQEARLRQIQLAFEEENDSFRRRYQERRKGMLEEQKSEMEHLLQQFSQIDVDNSEKLVELVKYVNSKNIKNKHNSSTYSTTLRSSGDSFHSGPPDHDSPSPLVGRPTSLSTPFLPSHPPLLQVRSSSDILPISRAPSEAVPREVMSEALSTHSHSDPQQSPRFFETDLERQKKKKREEKDALNELVMKSLEGFSITTKTNPAAPSPQASLIHPVAQVW